jgi:arginine/lysine/ornithine decarboxylase
MIPQDAAMTTPIVDFVRHYQQADISRLHMPGHKGTPLLGCEPWDITEIKGADELYEADGIIAESEANATRLFGTQHTYYAAEGSSQCIRAMLYLALLAAPKTDKRPWVLAARNAHKAFLYACALLDVDAEWLWGNSSQSAGQNSLCSCPVTAQQVQTALEQAKAGENLPFAVYVTSPDYLGGMQDIAAFSAVCSAFGVPLLVDNAHGAYLPFLPEESRTSAKQQHPIALGAAMCCDSGHKTLPVLTGGAYLHLGENAPVQEETVRGALCLFGSTSPSYLILQSLDRCNLWLAKGGTERFGACAARVRALAQRLDDLASEHGASHPLIHPTDEPLKLVLDSTVAGCTGKELADVLRRHKVECEYADDRFIVLMFTPENPARDDIRILEAMHAAFTESNVSTLHKEQETDETALFIALEKQSKQRCTIRQAMFAKQETISVEQAQGRICALPAVSCPPAIPIAVSGEEISEAALALFRRYGIESVAVVV